MNDATSRSTTLTRRRFLERSTGLAVALSSSAGYLPYLLGDDAPSEAIRMGCIGMGGHGTRHNLRALLGERDARVVAVCDVFEDRRAAARDQVNKRYDTQDCDAYNDFRRILDRKDIDAVMISTPDHWHVPMSVLALRAGKDVICEKPTLTIRQGRILADTVRKQNAVFQTSTEDRSIPCYHQLAQIVRNGLIGRVTEVHVQLPAGQRFPNESPCPVPKGLDYDLWLGPAPFAPYTRNRTEAQHWRHVWDYSGGKFSDWGMHQLDTVQWALDTERTGPVEVEGHGTTNDGSLYNTFVEYDVSYRYENGVKLRVKSGGTSLRFVGEAGWAGNAGWRKPVEAHSDEVVRWTPGPTDLKLYTNPRGEHREFLDCVRSRRDPYFPAEIGHRCASLLHIGNISMRLRRKLRWDPRREEFQGDEEANALRARPARAPWSVEA